MSHTSSEDPPWKKKTKPCPFYLTGNCLFAHRCNFIHPNPPPDGRHIPKIGDPLNTRFDETRALARQTALKHIKDDTSLDVDESLDEDDGPISSDWSDSEDSQYDLFDLIEDDTRIAEPVVAPSPTPDENAVASSSDSDSPLKYESKQPRRDRISFLAALSEKLAKRHGLFVDTSSISNTTTSSQPLQPSLMQRDDDTDDTSRTLFGAGHAPQLSQGSIISEATVRLSQHFVDNANLSPVFTQSDSDPSPHWPVASFHLPPRAERAQDMSESADEDTTVRPSSNVGNDTQTMQFLPQAESTDLLDGLLERSDLSSAHQTSTPQFPGEDRSTRRGLRPLRLSISSTLVPNPLDNPRAMPPSASSDGDFLSSVAPAISNPGPSNVFSSTLHGPRLHPTQPSNRVDSPTILVDNSMSVDMSSATLRPHASQSTGTRSPRSNVFHQSQATSPTLIDSEMSQAQTPDNYNYPISLSASPMFSASLTDRSLATPSPAPSVSSRSSSSSTTPGSKLFFAIAQDSPEAVSALLESGEATPNEECGPHNALTFAAQNTHLQRRGEIVAALLAYGADPADLEPEPDEEDNTGGERQSLDPHVQYLLNRARAQQERQSSHVLAQLSEYAPLRRLPFGLIGQEMVMEAFFRAVAMHEVTNRDVPLVFIFCGPSGHGKSLFAGKIGESFQCPSRTFNLTMLHNYPTIWELPSLASAQAASTSLSEFLQLNDGERCVVILDELEKVGNATALWPLLMPWELAHITLPGNVTVNVRNVIWIATSNLGHEMMLEKNLPHPLTPPAYQKLMADIRSRISEHFGPSLISRVTAVLPFTIFDLNELKALSYSCIAPHIARHGMRLSESGKDTLLDKVMAEYRSEEGARSLQRAAAAALLDMH